MSESDFKISLKRALLPGQRTRSGFGKSLCTARSNASIRSFPVAMHVSFAIGLG
jgi:hypothetical protein